MKNKARWFKNLSIKNKVQRIFIVSMIVMFILSALFFISITRIKLARTFADRNTEKVNSVQKTYSSIINNVNNISRMIMVIDSVLAYLRDDKQPSDLPMLSDDAVITVNDDAVPESNDAVVAEIYRILDSFSGSYSVFVLKQCVVPVKNPMRTDSEPESPAEYEK
ncbi:MAG: hypothetical protein IKH71_11650, partial [Oscillospiraceae bacterium]|nr:hypothetical protein [Oscillospiraceae bacterium]